MVCIYGRVKLEDEAVVNSVPMVELDRLSKSIEWIDLEFIERERPPREIVKKVFGALFRLAG